MRAPSIAALLLLSAAAHAEPLSGRWVSDEDPSLRVTLQEAASGAVSGSLASEGTSAAISLRRSAAGFSGTVQMDGETIPCSARLAGAQLVLTLGAPAEAESISLRRASAAGAAPRANAAPSSPAKPQRSVVINATRLTPEDLARIERNHSLRIADANYWYDAISGAWGAQGGPAAGFLPPSLALGGKLRADASGGGTGVFINGREAHPFDVRALASLLGSPILPARYFLTAQGFAGFEGGPPLWNLIAIAGSSAGGGAGGGGDTTWSSRLSSGIDGGDTGAVFLPNGGMVSY